MQTSIDELGTKVADFEREKLALKSQYEVSLQKHTDRTTADMTRFEAEKNTLDERWKSALEDYNKMKKNFDEERNKNTALRHEITTHQKHLQEMDRQLKTLSSEKQHANSTLTQIKGELAETKRAIHTHEQTIAFH
jgi:chromosome segregation ATPase